MIAQSGGAIRFGAAFAAVTAAIAIALTSYGGVLWLLNALAAAIGSFCAALGSFMTYRSLVLREAAQSDGVLDTIDDKAGLYDEDTPIEPEGKAQTIEPEQSDKTPALKTKAAYAVRWFSPIRALGYAPLIIGFFALHTNGVFMPAPFLIALGALPISALLFAALSGTAVADNDKKRQEKR